MDNDEEKSGLEKQKDKKAEQERKEEGKGSEKGQQQREENSKKWWNLGVIRGRYITNSFQPISTALCGS